MVPIGRTIDTYLSGKTAKSVECETCACEYLYVAERHVGATGTSLLWLDDEGAKRRSQTEAERRLEKSLQRAVDLVPCPQCGQLQADMVRSVKLKRAALVWIVTILLALTAWCSALTGWQPGFWVAPSVFFFGGILGIVWFVLCDPNRGDSSVRAATTAAITRQEYEAAIAQQKSRRQQRKTASTRRSRKSRRQSE